VVPDEAEEDAALVDIGAIVGVTVTVTVSRAGVGDAGSFAVVDSGDSSSSSSPVQSPSPSSFPSSSSPSLSSPLTSHWSSSSSLSSVLSLSLPAPAATNRASASSLESQDRLVPALFTNGRATQAVPDVHGVRAHLPETHWAKEELTQAIAPSKLPVRNIRVA
jgi:hypothetical protein